MEADHVARLVGLACGAFLFTALALQWPSMSRRERVTGRTRAAVLLALGASLVCLVVEVVLA